MKGTGQGLSTPLSVAMISALIGAQITGKKMLAGGPGDGSMGAGRGLSACSALLHFEAGCAQGAGQAA